MTAATYPVEGITFSEQWMSPGGGGNPTPVKVFGAVCHDCEWAAHHHRSAGATAAGRYDIEVSARGHRDIAHPTSCTNSAIGVL